MNKFVPLGLLLLLTACSEFGPFVDTRREAGQTEPVGQSRPDRIAVCYNPVWHSDKSIEKLATAACAQQNKQAVYADTSYFNCRFVSPNTAFYTCQ